MDALELGVGEVDSMPLMPNEILERIYDTAIGAGLHGAGYRDALFSGIPAVAAAGIALRSAPALQLEADLRWCNEQQLADGRNPLRRWLENAERLRRPFDDGKKFAEFLELASESARVLQPAPVAVATPTLPVVGNQPARLRILFLGASPDNEVQLCLDREVRSINEQLRLATNRDGFQFDQRMAVRPRDLTRAFLEVRPNVVHFSGHGSKRGELYLENDAGEAHPVDAATLADLFRLSARNVRCVLLNACYSETQARAIAPHVQFVIGMSNSISDGAAIAYSVGFYQALGEGEPVDRAHEFGVLQMRLGNTEEHSVPVLVTAGA